MQKPHAGILLFYCSGEKHNAFHTFTRTNLCIVRSIRRNKTNDILLLLCVVSKKTTKLHFHIFLFIDYSIQFALFFSKCTLSLCTLTKYIQHAWMQNYLLFFWTRILAFGIID